MQAQTETSRTELNGADATEEQIAELMELAQKRLPVFDIVSHPVPVTVELARD